MDEVEHVSLGDLPVCVQELILAACCLPTRIALAATSRDWRAHALQAAPQEPMPCGQCTCVHSMHVTQYGGAAAQDSQAIAARLQAFQLIGNSNSAPGCIPARTLGAQKAVGGYASALWCLVYPRRHESFAMELLQHMAQQAPRMYGRQLRAMCVARLCAGTEPEQLLDLCAVHPFLLFVDRPDGLQAVLNGARVRLAHHSVDMRKARRAGSVQVYASQVLLPRLQVSDQLDHVLV